MNFERYNKLSNSIISKIINDDITNQSLADKKEASSDTREDLTHSIDFHDKTHLELISRQIATVLGITKKSSLVRNNMSDEGKLLALDILNYVAQKSHSPNESESQEINFLSPLLLTTCTYISGDDDKIKATISAKELNIAEEQYDAYKDYYKRTTQEFVGRIISEVLYNVLNQGNNVKNYTTSLPHPTATDFIKEVQQHSLIKTLHERLTPENYASSAKRTVEDRSPLKAEDRSSEKQQKKEETKKHRVDISHSPESLREEMNEEEIPSNRPATPATLTAEGLKKVSFGNLDSGRR